MKRAKIFFFMLLFVNMSFISVLAMSDDGALTQIDYQHHFGASNLKVTIGNPNPASGISVQQQGLQLKNVTNLGRSGVDGETNSYIYEALLQYEFKINVLSQINEGEAFDAQIQRKSNEINYLTIYGAPSHLYSVSSNKWVKNYHIRYDGYDFSGRQVSTKAQGYDGPIDVSVDFVSSTPDLSVFQDRFAALGYSFRTDSYSAVISQAKITDCNILSPDSKQIFLSSDPQAPTRTSVVNDIDYYTDSVKSTLSNQLQEYGVGIQTKTISYNVPFNGGQGGGIATSYTGDLDNIHVRIKPDVSLINQRIVYGFNNNLRVSTGMWSYSGRIESNSGAYDSTHADRIVGWQVKNYNIQMVASVFVRVATVITYASTTQAEDYEAPDPVVVAGDIVWDDYVNTAPLLFEEFEESIGAKFLNWLEANKVAIIIVLILIVVMGVLGLVIYVRAQIPSIPAPPKYDYYPSRR